MRVRWYCAQRPYIPVSYRNMPKVETQDFASHEKVSAIYIDRNVLIDIEFVACETQDFASLLLVNIIMNPRLSPYITMASALYRRKILRLTRK